MAVLMNAWAGIRKKKSVAISMGILIMLAVAMFDVGITLMSSVGNFYDKENNRLNGAHYMVRFTGNAYQDEYLDFFLKDERVETAQTVEAVMMNMASFPEGGVISPNFIAIDDEELVSGWQIVEQMEVSEGKIIYAPTFFKDMGYKLGDKLVLNYNKQNLEFTIAGFTQSTWFQSSVSSLVNLYVPQSTYEQLFEEIGGGYLLLVRVHDLADVSQLQQDFKEKTSVNIEAVSLTAEVMDFTCSDMKQGSTMVVSILSAVLFVFSFLMVLVAVIVMRFRIQNHIENQMTNIGAMSAMGYTGTQIKWSIALEFLLISLAGTVLGIAASYGIIAGLGSLITNSVGVAWRGGIHGLYDGLSALVIMGIVLLVSGRAANKAAKILPIEALRGGIKSHSFDKNHFPLEHTAGSLPTVLGLKNIMFQKKTYLMVGTIFAGIVFACGFAVIIWWNLGKDDEMSKKLTGFEISDIMVYTAPHADYDELEKELLTLPGVRKTSLYETDSAKVEGELLTCYLSDDYEKLETIEAYEGSFPKYENEIAISGVLAKAWGKKIGDTVSVQTDKGSADYVISGLGQTMNNFGRQCFLSLEGMKRVNPLYEKHTILVYLEPGIEIDAYIREMESQFLVLSPTYASEEERQEISARKRAEERLATLLSSYGVDSAQYALIENGEIILSGDTDSFVIDRIENNRMLFVSNVDSIASSVSIMSLLILAGTFCIIILVLYMVIKSMLVRQKHEFGIYKALGYTDKQLMEEIAVSFLPVAAAGTLLGMVLSYVGVSPIASLLFEKVGISSLDLAVNPWLMIGMGILVIALTYVIAMLSARKIKGITVYGLLTEE